MFEELLPYIERNDSIVIFGHIFPDGDCYGSQLGLRELIKLNYPNKKVYAVGTGIRRFYDFIGRMDEVSDDVIKESLAILVDGNDFDRMEDRRVSTAKEFIKIDHHIENFKFTQGPFVIDPQANSACDLILLMAQENNWKLNPTICNALYLGILTDTGRFQFVENFADTFHQVALLCENGANPQQINSILNVTNEAALRFKGYVLTHYQESEGGALYLTLSFKKMQELKVSPSKAGSMVNLLANVLDHPIWMFFCENENGTIHAELRSNGPAVQPIVAKYGGGGHLLAAGVTLGSFSEQTINMLIKDCDEAIKEYKKEHN